MTDNDSLLDMSPRTRLKAEVTWLMLKGAGYAALFVLAIWATLAVTRAVGLVLPEESQTAADPAPQAFIDWAARVAAEEAGTAATGEEAEAAPASE